MFEINKPVKEAPLLGAVVGGMIGGGGTLAGMMSVAGMVGMGLGAVGGSLLGNMMSPKMPDMNISQASPQNVPSTPPAAVAPAVPDTPTATPTPAPVDTSGPTPAPFNPGEASTPTASEIATGELARKRKGRVSTILTSREATVGEEETEKLGG